MSQSPSERAEQITSEADAAAAQPGGEHESPQDPTRALVQDISRLEESN